MNPKFARPRPAESTPRSFPNGSPSRRRAAAGSPSTPQELRLAQRKWRGAPNGRRASSPRRRTGPHSEDVRSIEGLARGGDLGEPAAEWVVPRRTPRGVVRVRLHPRPSPPSGVGSAGFANRTSASSRAAPTAGIDRISPHEAPSRRPRGTRVGASRPRLRSVRPESPAGSGRRSTLRAGPFFGGSRAR